MLTSEKVDELLPRNFDPGAWLGDQTSNDVTGAGPANNSLWALEQMSYRGN